MLWPDVPLTAGRNKWFTACVVVLWGFRMLQLSYAGLQHVQPVLLWFLTNSDDNSSLMQIVGACACTFVSTSCMLDLRVYEVLEFKFVTEQMHIVNSCRYIA